VLTISQLASYAGVTVRAVRHYHAKGLLPEPERDHSGYRRYGASCLVRLLRVRGMRELGLPLQRIGTLLAGPEPALHEALDALDAELAEQAERIAVRRAQLAAVRTANPDPELPERLSRLFARAAADGAPLRALQQEKEVLLLDLALHPNRAEAITAEYEELYDRLRTRPEYQEVTRRFDALTDSAPDDAEVERLAAVLADAVRAEYGDAIDHPSWIPAPEAERIFQDWVDGLPPAQRRVMARVVELASEEGIDRRGA